MTDNNNLTDFEAAGESAIDPVLKQQALEMSEMKALHPRNEAGDESDNSVERDFRMFVNVEHRASIAKNSDMSRANSIRRGPTLVSQLSEIKMNEPGSP